MGKLGKIVVTMGIVLLFILFSAVNSGLREASGRHTPGFLGLIIFVAMYGAIRAVWKSGKKDDDHHDVIMQK